MKACYRNYLGPLVLMVTGALMALLLSQASGAPPPAQYARAGLADAGPPDEGLRAMVDAGDIPTDDGLGTSPSFVQWIEIGGALWTVISLVVAATPTQKDDEALSRVRAALERVSYLRPINVPGLFSLPGTRKPPPAEQGV